MTKRKYETIEIMRQKSSMSQRITAEKDEEYAFYSGASWDIAENMAFIDFLLKYKLAKPRLVPLLKLYRAYLDQKKKAFFSSVGSSEISKLGFILGIKVDTIRAT